MKNNQRLRQAIFGLLIVQFLCFIIPPPVFCQTEKFGIISYTAPKGWLKMETKGGIIFSISNKTTNRFCFLTVFVATVSAGSSQKDFAKYWNERVVKPYDAKANPETHMETDNDGWETTSGTAPVELFGVKSHVILTVISGFGKTQGILSTLMTNLFWMKLVLL